MTVAERKLRRAQRALVQATHTRINPGAISQDDHITEIRKVARTMDSNSNSNVITQSRRIGRLSNDLKQFYTKHINHFAEVDPTCHRIQSFA